MTDPLDLDAVGQAELIRSGQVSPTELVAAAIARVEERNPALNAVIHPRFERALEEAGTVTDGPFRGVPMVVKNALGCVADHPYDLGMRVLADTGHRSDHDSELVRRYRAAGFVIIGSTNVPELALSVTTEPVAHGATRNPWDPSRSAGGSSGGSGSAVASGMVAVGHGNDMGGSIRIPAAWCGLFGLKPTYGRTTLAPDFNEYWGQFSHEHVLVRSVRDSAAVLDAVHGPAAGDISPAPAPRRPFLDEVGADPGRLRIAVVRTEPFSDRRPEAGCADAVERAALLLAELGHDVVDAGPGLLDRPEAAPDGALVVSVHVASELLRVGALLGRNLGEADVEPWTWALAQGGFQVPAPAHTLALHAVQRFRRDLAAWADDHGYDLVLLSSTGTGPPPIGAGGGSSDFGDVLRIILPVTGFLGLFNVAGWPAASVPFGSVGGTPIGVQLAAPYGREDRVLQVAAQIERANPWPLVAPTRG